MVLLLVSLAVMLQPTVDMAAAGIMVCPVENTAFFIPLIFTIKRDLAPFAQAADPGG